MSFFIPNNTYPSFNSNEDHDPESGRCPNCYEETDVTFLCDCCGQEVCHHCSILRGFFEVKHHCNDCMIFKSENVHHNEKADVEQMMMEQAEKYNLEYVTFLNEKGFGEETNSDGFSPDTSTENIHSITQSTDSSYQGSISPNESDLSDIESSISFSIGGTTIDGDSSDGSNGDGSNDSSNNGSNDGSNDGSDNGSDDGSDTGDTGDSGDTDSGDDGFGGDGFGGDGFGGDGFGGGGGDDGSGGGGGDGSGGGGF